jgi:hypothetical protein
VGSWRSQLYRVDTRCAPGLQVTAVQAFFKETVLKDLILAGGTGSRLFPLTKVTNKHLLPVGREPMIFHPISIKLALYDEREGSPTKGAVNEFFLGEHSEQLVQVPPHVWHGFKNISESEAIVVNITTHPYNPEEPDEYRLPAHESHIPYQRARRDG